MHGVETTQHKSEECCSIHSKEMSIMGQNCMQCVLLYDIYGERLLWVIDYGWLNWSGIWKGQNWWQIVFECRNYSNNFPLEDIHSKGTLKYMWGWGVQGNLTSLKWHRFSGEWWQIRGFAWVSAVGKFVTELTVLARLQWRKTMLPLPLCIWDHWSSTGTVEGKVDWHLQNAASIWIVN